MTRSVTVQPNDEKTFDIDLSNEMKRSDETVTIINGFTDDQDVSLTYASQLIIGAKALRVTISGATNGASYKVTLQFTTNYSPNIEVEFWVVCVDT